MKRVLSLAVAATMVAAMLFSFLPAVPAMAAGGDGKVTRRALVIGNAKYAQSPLLAPEYDASHMVELFKQMSFSGTTGGAAEQGALAKISKKVNQTRVQILSDIATELAGADADDVSYFYYSGHGSVADGEAQIVGVDLSFISLTDLKAALDKIPGTKVILLDSCFSGGFINKAPANTKTTMVDTPFGQKPWLVPSHGSSSVIPVADGGSTLKKTKSSDVKTAFPSILNSKPSTDKDTAELFYSGVKTAFSRSSRYLNNSSYIVLTASSMVEYSYELPFCVLYGSDFYINGKSLTDHLLSCSGEFTGMLIAGAGKVKFSDTYGEMDLLADYNGDNLLTAAEMEHFLKGATLFSDVRMYSSADEAGDAANSPVIFSHASATTNPRVKLTGGTADITTPVTSAVSIPITLDLSGISSELTKKLIVYRFPKTTDGTGVNGDLEQIAVRTLNIDNPSSVAWDGKDDEGIPVLDGTYHIVLETGEGAVSPSDPGTMYPGVTVVLARGYSEFDSSNKIRSFTSSGSSKVYSGSLTTGSDGPEKCLWFTAPMTGAMNVYADVGTGRLSGMQALCSLYDAEGNAVNTSVSSLKTGKLYMVFAVEANKNYRLKFGFASEVVRAYYQFSLKLNPAIAADAKVSAVGNGFESWYLPPGTVESGNYVFQSAGQADTFAALVDGNQTSLVASGDDFNDGNFLFKTPLKAEQGYLLVVRENDNQLPGDSAIPYTFKVNSPSKAPVFDAGGYDTVTLTGGSAVSKVADEGGSTTYLVIKTGSSTAKWSFAAEPTQTGGELSEDNDPYLLLMDANYNQIGFSDDYGEDYGSRFAVILDANKTYILACRGVGSYPYDYAVRITQYPLYSTRYVVGNAKAVFMDNSALSLDRFGNVSGWGYNFFGELGLGSMAPTPSPAVLALPGDQPAVDIWAGEVNGFARLKNGRYCYWGVSWETETGFVAPTVLSCLDGMDVAEIACTPFGVALVRTYTGELYMMSTDENKIMPVTLPGMGAHSVKQIATTEGSFFALTYDGKLFSWGMNFVGECGVGSEDVIDEPTRVVASRGTLIDRIATGWDHVIALSREGSVYVWGLNQDNQLGQGASSTVLMANKPLRISAGVIARRVIKAIYAGADDSMCVDTDGNTYAWGDNSYGQLGLGNASETPTATQISYYGAGEVPVKSMSAGAFAVFAQDFNQNVYGYGANLDDQLGFVGQPSDTGITKLMTLRGTLLGPSTKLNSLLPLHVSAGKVTMNGTAVTVDLDQNTSSCYIVPQPESDTATYVIGSSAVTGKLITVANPGAKATETVAVSNADETITTYTITVQRAKSTDSTLKSLKTTSGALLSPAFAKGTKQYTITVPEPMSGVLVTPVTEGYGAHYAIDSLAKDTPKTYSPALGSTQTGRVVVTAQAGNQTTYGLTVKRPYLLTSLTATPVYSGYPSLSPGGTNRLTVYYSISFPATVKVEVQKGGVWYTLMTRADAKAGVKVWTWDGKLNGVALTAGTYALRVTPSYAGKACTSRKLTVKILGKPRVSIPFISTYVFKTNGSTTMAYTVKWTVLTDVKVEILNSAGTVVNTAFNSTAQAPATRRFYWNGKLKSGALAPAGTYRIRVTAGGATPIYLSFTLKH